MGSVDKESRRLDILSVKKEANLSAREVGEVEVGKMHSNASSMACWFRLRFRFVYVCFSRFFMTSISLFV